MKRLIGVLTITAIFAAGCNGRSPGTPKPTVDYSKEETKSKLDAFNATDINSYPAGSDSTTAGEAGRRAKFLANYIQMGQKILRSAKIHKMNLEHKQTVEANIQTAKALLKSHQSRFVELGGKKGAENDYGYL